MSWIRLTGKKAQDPDSIEEYGSDYDADSSSRIYGWKGKKWPRIIIDVKVYTGGSERTTSLGISCSYKEAKGQWMAEHSIPLELYKDLMEMLSQKPLPAYHGYCIECGELMYPFGSEHGEGYSTYGVPLCRKDGCPNYGYTDREKIEMDNK